MPIRSTLIGTLVALVSIGAAYISPDNVFSFLINSYGAVALFVYLLIAIAQARLRRRLEREDPDALVMKMWLFPWLSYLTVLGMVLVIAAMAISPDTRSQFLLSVAVLGVLLLAYAAIHTRRKRSGWRPDPEEDEAGAARASVPDEEVPA